MSDDFQTAYMRAREKVGVSKWPLLSNEEQEQAVAEQLRALQAESRPKPGPAGG